MKSKLTSILVALAVAGGLSSCEAPVDNRNVDPKDILTLFGIEPLWDGSAFDGCLSAGNLTKAYLGGTTERYENQAQFYDANNKFVTVSSVSLNGSALSTFTGKGYLTRSSATYDAYHVWNVSGANGHATFTDSVLAPAKFDINSPSYLGTDTIDKSSGFTLTWDDPETDSVSIFLTWDAALSRTIDNNLTDTNYHSASFRVVNNGSYSIPSAALTPFPNSGVVHIVVGAANMKLATHSSKTYLLTALTAAQSYAFIKP